MSRSETIVEEEYNLSNKLPSNAVIEAIASAEDVGTTELSTFSDITIHDYVDPDALNKLLTSGNLDDMSINFSVGEYIVWIEKGRVAVARPVAKLSDSE